jgi:hypothetical protein
MLEELVYSAAQRALDQQSTALWPARVLFALDADRVEEELFPYREEPATYFLEAAHGLHNAYLENEDVIERRELVFRLALLALGAETLLWALALALT